MFRIFFRVLLIFLIVIILIISYLSIFGLKTNRFNELIKSQIIKYDSKLNINLDKVYIKLNVKQRSFILDSQNVDLFIQKEVQKIKNINVLIDLRTFFNRDNKIKKIIINSKENDIIDLLTFIRAYKISIPALYLENSVSKGKIKYDIVINYDDKNKEHIGISGKIIDTKLDILGKEKFDNINFNFSYENQNLLITNLKFKYNEIDFKSKKIKSHIKKNLINIEGDFQNKLDNKLLSKFSDIPIYQFLDKNNILLSNSNFKIIFNKKFKIKDYKIESKIDLKKLTLTIKNNHIKNYFTDFKNQITLTGGSLNFNLNNKNKINLKIKSKYFLNENQKPKNILIKYSKLNLFEKYELDIDISENNLVIDEINFTKNLDEKLFLNLIFTKNKNNYKLKDLKVFNKRNSFNAKNIFFNKNYQILDFDNFQANYYNKENYYNSIFINKKKNVINFSSTSIDLSDNIDAILKSKNNKNILNIFKNLNSTVNLNLKSVKIDKDHEFQNFIGNVMIKNNKIDEANLSAKFNNNNNFIYTIKEIDKKKITTIFSDLAKPFVRKFDFIKGFEGGKLDYTSVKVNENLSKSEIRIYDFKLQDMPILTKLLSLASLQGIADLATGEGIRFNEVEMFFNNSKNLITINEIYALGPAISILMEGYVEKNKLVSLKGTLVPATTINKTIAKIPLLGDILVGKKSGEGVFGVSFKIKGSPSNLETKVNPIKTLTPRFITRTLDKIKKSN